MKIGLIWQNERGNIRENILLENEVIFNVSFNDN